MNRSAAPRSTLPVALATLALGVIVAACSGAAGSAAPTAASPAAQSPAAPIASASAATPIASAGAAGPAGLPSGGGPGGPGGAVAGPAATYADVAYASTSSSQVLDIWMPDGATGPVPLVIFVHGGAFKGGDKAMEGGNVASVLAAGYAAASLDYRLSGEALFPAAVQDVKAAVRFLRANAAQYGLDPDRFAAWGESAGGNLVAMIGTTGDQSTVLDDPALGNAGVSSAVQAVVDLYGPTDFLQMDAQFASAAPAACNGQVQAHDPADSPESAYLGAAIQTVPDQAAAANPITYIATAKTLPVFLIAHGDSDCLVPNQQSQILHEALQAAGATSTFNLVAGAGHGDQAISTSQTPIALEMLRSVFGK
jgi:acetyl esterase/lipase